MGTAPNSEVLKILKDLRQGFLDKLPEKIQQLSGLVDRAMEQPRDHERIGALLNAVHKLHGTAGTYGLHEVSEVAGAWEQELQTAREAGAGLDDAAVAGAQRRFREVKAASLSAGDPGKETPLHPAVADGDRMSDAHKSAGKNPLVLLVEDDADLRELLRSTLEIFGLSVSSAADVATAIELFRDRRFSLVITDFNLPDANGKILVKTIRESDVDIPVILVSGKINRKELGDMISESVDVFLEKPVDMDRLINSVRRLLHVGDERKKAKKRGEVLLGLSSKLALGMKKAALLKMLVQSISEVTPFQSVGLQVLDAGGSRLSLSASHGQTPVQTGVGLSADQAREVFERGFKYDIASFIPAGLNGNGPEAGEESYSQLKARKYSWSSGDRILTAVRTTGNLWGFLSIDRPADDLRPSQDSMRMFSLIANQIANVLENNESYNHQVLLNSQLETVSEVARAALSSFDLEAIQRIITSAAVNHFGHSFACFLEKTANPDEYVIKYAAGAAAESLPDGNLAASGRVIDLLRDLESSGQPLQLKAGAGETGISGRGKDCSALAIPIRTRGAVNHILLVEDDLQPEFKESQVRAYVAMAAQTELIWSRALNQKYLEKTANELGESYQKLKEVNDLNLKLQNIIKRYVPASTWRTAMQATDEAELQAVENMPEMPVMFVDISGFSVLSEVAEPDTIVSLLNIYFTMVSGIISQYSGEVIKYIGDGMMAYFKKKEDAILAAGDILSSKNRLNQELTRIGSVEVDLHLGVACGPAILCHVGPFYHLGRTLLGDTVNTAARLESEALPGTALFDKRLLPRGLDAASFGLAEIGSLRLKGKSRPVEVLTFKRSEHLYSDPASAGSTYLIVTKRAVHGTG
jgi:class 3 adenylate cyclase/DNA-binding response OmpR family regulator